MDLRQILSLISEIANEFGISTPYITGGAARDKIAKRLNRLEDIDVTTGDPSIQNLAKELDMRLQKMNVPHTFQIMSDHSKIKFPNELKIDFSSNYNTPGIKEILEKSNINPTPMNRELFSRDFSINSLLMDINLQDIHDPTGFGIKDIENKLIRTNLRPEITLGQDARRIVRVIYLAAKLGFEIDEPIKEWIKNNPGDFSKPPASYTSGKLVKAFEYNANLTMKLLAELNLLPYVPSTQEILPYLTGSLKKSQTNDILIKNSQDFFSNYDYSSPAINGSEPGPGGGLYSNMDQFSSTEDFIKNKRKARKKQLKKIRKQNKTAEKLRLLNIINRA